VGYFHNDKDGFYEEKIEPIAIVFNDD